MAKLNEAYTFWASHFGLKPSPISKAVLFVTFVPIVGVAAVIGLFIRLFRKLRHPIKRVL